MADGFERHRHCEQVTFPEGSVIWAVSFDAAEPYSRYVLPDFGLYLDERWAPPWAHEHLDWPDFGVPSDRTHALSALASLHTRARRGDRVEVGCLGGHGRTGTALVCIAVLTGVPVVDAVSWVRNNYCGHAVETDEQVAFVAQTQDEG
jgi:protein-tyrosine phosphatase